MPSWIFVLLVTIIVFFLFEELSHYIWRIYLRDPNEMRETRLRQLIKNAKQVINKYSKNPSH